MSTTCQASARMLKIVNRIQACFPGADAVLGDVKAAWEQQGDQGELREIMPVQWSRLCWLAVQGSRDPQGLPKDLTLRMLLSPKLPFLLMTFSEDSQVARKPLLCFTLPLCVSCQLLTWIFFFFSPLTELRLHSPVS